MSNVRTHQKNMLLYHGTLGSKRYRFESFCHFGTRDAALERIARRLLDGHEGDPIILRVRFRFEQSEIIQIAEDWGSNQPIALARVMKDHFARISEEKYQIFESIRADLIDLKSRGGDFRNTGVNLLRDAFTRMGVKAIRYPNGVEHSVSDSYCIVEPVRRICVGAQTPTQDELDRAKKVIRDSLSAGI